MASCDWHDEIVVRASTYGRCASTATSAVSRWVFRAIVYKTAASKGFVGYGDADPSNTSSLVRGAEMRVAETRAVNRALRKAYGIGLCSVEELGSQPSSIPPPARRKGGRSTERQRLHQRPAQTAGQTLPPDSKVRARSQPGETLCRRFLWHAKHSVTPVVISSRRSFQPWLRKPRKIVRHSFAS